MQEPGVSVKNRSTATGFHRRIVPAVLTISIMIFSGCSSDQQQDHDYPGQQENHKTDNGHAETLRDIDELYEWVMDGNSLTEDEFNSVFCPDIQFEAHRERCRDILSTQEARDSVLNGVREGTVPFHVIFIGELTSES